MFSGRVQPTRSRAENREPLRLNAVKWGRLFSYLRPYWRRMALAIGSLAIASAMNLTFPLVIVRLLDSVLQQRDLGQLILLTLAWVAMFMVQAGFSFFQS